MHTLCVRLFDLMKLSDKVPKIKGVVSFEEFRFGLLSSQIVLRGTRSQSTINYYIPFENRLNWCK